MRKSRKYMYLLLSGGCVWISRKVKTRHQTPLKELLEARGLSIRDVAAASGTTEATVSRWRNRVTPPAAEYRAKIIRRFKLTAEELQKLGWPEGQKEPAGV